MLMFDEIYGGGSWWARPAVKLGGAQAPDSNA